MDEGRLLLTVSEVAARLGLGRSTIYEMVMRGDIPSIKIGRARRIPASALEVFVTECLNDAMAR